MIDDSDIPLEIVDEVGDIEARDSSVMHFVANVRLILADLHSLSTTATLHTMTKTMAGLQHNPSLPASTSMNSCMDELITPIMAANTPCQTILRSKSGATSCIMPSGCR